MRTMRLCPRTVVVPVRCSCARSGTAGTILTSASSPSPLRRAPGGSPRLTYRCSRSPHSRPPPVRAGGAMASVAGLPPRPILRQSSMSALDGCWRDSTSEDSDDAPSTSSSEMDCGGYETPGARPRVSACGFDQRRRCSTPGLTRSVSWTDERGVGELEAVRSIDRRPKRPGFFAQSFAVIKDEFLYSFGRGVLARDAAADEAPPEEQAAAHACADNVAERALFEARENAVLNVERVRELAAAACLPP